MDFDDVSSSVHGETFYYVLGSDLQPTKDKELAENWLEDGWNVAVLTGSGWISHTDFEGDGD